MEVSFMPWLLYSQGRSPWYPLDRRLSGPQSWSGLGGERKNSHPLLALEPLIIHPIAQCLTTELSWLLIIIVLLNKNTANAVTVNSTTSSEFIN
jgi:hypothetical protein